MIKLNLSNVDNNIILSSDSYKYSMHVQYPPKTEVVYSYIEARGGNWNKTVFFGLQAFLRRYLANPVTMEDIDVAEAIITAHGEPFNREGWEYIVNNHNGKLPVVIRSADEGSVIPIKNVLVTIENTDPKCFWLTTFLETALLRAIWYPTTVATNSYESKKLIKKFLDKTGDLSGIDFKLHDFGARGVSSKESAGIGGAAHLINFMGTDTVEALTWLMRYYDTDVCGFSIPAAEHSTITSWGRDSEVDAYRNMLNKFAKPGSLVAVVSDSYDIYNACKLWGTALKQQVVDSGATVVVRPDSGKPHVVVLECLKILEAYFGSVVNHKGYKVLNNVRVIQGDGIDHYMIELILQTLEQAGYSADNVAFGQGGALLQQVNRDTMKFAMKCSAIRIDGKWHNVSKDPITDPGKKSKEGRVVLYKDSRGYYSGIEDWVDTAMQERFRDGRLLNETGFGKVRANSNL